MLSPLFALLFLTLVSAFAEDHDTSLLAEHVSLPDLNADFLAPHLELTGAGQVAGVPKSFAASLITPRRDLSTVEQWQQFESEFGIREQNPSMLKRQIASVKFGIDTIIFAADKLLNDVQDSLIWERIDGNWQHGNLAPPAPRLPDAPPPAIVVQHARMKLDLAYRHLSPYVGFSIVLPWSD